MHVEHCQSYLAARTRVCCAPEQECAEERKDGASHGPGGEEQLDEAPHDHRQQAAKQHRPCNNKRHAWSRAPGDVHGSSMTERNREEAGPARTHESQVCAALGGVESVGGEAAHHRGCDQQRLRQAARQHVTATVHREHVWHPHGASHLIRVRRAVDWVDLPRKR